MTGRGLGCTGPAACCRSYCNPHGEVQLPLKQPAPIAATNPLQAVQPLQLSPAVQQQAEAPAPSAGGATLAAAADAEDSADEAELSIDSGAEDEGSDEEGEDAAISSPEVPPPGPCISSLLTAAY